MFSPYYRRARERGRGDPTDHCAVNVSLYGRPARWSMTERGRTALHATRSSLAIGPSALHWDGSVLTITIDERAAPLPSRIRGTVRLTPRALPDLSFPLDAAGLHRWRPIAPNARVEVALEHPRQRWSGTGYLDANDGDGPLEDAFSGWHWSRAGLGDDTVILYDVIPRQGPRSCLALRCDAAGRASPFAAPPAVALGRSAWGVERCTRAESSRSLLSRTLVDAPFYTRSLIVSSLLGREVSAVHESLSLDRFNASWVRALLPFRMPRRSGPRQGSPTQGRIGAGHPAPSPTLSTRCDTRPPD